MAAAHVWGVPIPETKEEAVWPRIGAVVPPLPPKTAEPAVCADPALRRVIDEELSGSLPPSCPFDPALPPVSLPDDFAGGGDTVRPAVSDGAAASALAPVFGEGDVISSALPVPAFVVCGAPVTIGGVAGCVVEAVTVTPCNFAEG
jgi:hypothetical protein